MKRIIWLIILSILAAAAAAYAVDPKAWRDYLSARPSATTPAGESDLLPILQGGVVRKIAPGDLGLESIVGFQNRSTAQAARDTAQDAEIAGKLPAAVYNNNSSAYLRKTGDASQLTGIPSAVTYMSETARLASTPAANSVIITNDNHKAFIGDGFSSGGVPLNIDPSGLSISAAETLINPVMTSYTTPSGTVSTDGDASGHDAWNAFDNNTNSYWRSSGAWDPGKWVAYRTLNDTKYRLTKFTIGQHTMQNFRIQGSNDGSVWTTLITVNLPSTANNPTDPFFPFTSAVKTYSSGNTGAFSWFRILSDGNFNTIVNEYHYIYEADFYGTPASVYTPYAGQYIGVLDDNSGIGLRSLSTTVTTQGNTFNGISQLVKTDGAGKLPAIDGSQLTNLPGGNLQGLALNNWTQRTLPVSVGWEAIAWNGAVFCAVAAASDTAATSSDGITWTQRTLPVSANWTGIAWNGTVFCAVAASSAVAATSPDGITWTERTLPASATWTGIAWNGTVFCAVANGGTVAATSPDGITWTARTLPASASWSGIAWNGTVFCAVAYGSTIAATSPDGITWTQRTLPAALNWRGIAWNGAAFCVVGYDSAIAATSPDGVTWTERALPASASWTGIVWSGKVFCAVATGSTKAAMSFNINN